MNGLNPVRGRPGLDCGSMYLYCVFAHSPAAPFTYAVYAEDEDPLCVIESDRKFKVRMNKNF